jgi:Holliday junction resolvasome RuvABC DNA-binding subunit
LCRSAATKVDELEESDEMSSFQYRQLLNYLSDNVSGVGDSTVTAIEESFEDGDSFLDAAERAYRDRAWSELTQVSGVGESTAEKIALGIADRNGWENGAAESSFSFEQ